MAEYALQKKPWKVWMSSAPDPTGVMVSAYDLLNGVSLGHDILIYNGNLYSNGTFSASSFDDFYRYEIDISPVIFDKRAKPNITSIELGVDIGIENNSTSKANIYYYDKDAALYPEDIKSFYGVNNTWRTYFRSSSTMGDYSLEVGYKTVDFLTCTSVENEEDASSAVSSIVVYSKDSIFSSTMVFEDGKNAFTKIILNSSNEKVMKLIVGAVFFNSDTTMPSYSSTNISTAFSLLLKETELLKHIYFWVKAPFCADYIDPEDFNQDLNQDSDVVHRNLLLGSNYDSIRNNFGRYHEGYTYNNENPTVSEFLERMSRPYIPTNSPLKDFLSKGLLSEIGGSDDVVTGALVESNATALIKNSYEDDHIIGSLLSVPGNAYTNTEIERYTPFNFYDPESREEESYYTGLGRIPTLIGRDGNLTTDGRLMSPTIDEIWYIIKKLISGEQAAGAVRGTKLSSPYNENSIASTLTEAVMAQYKYNGKTIDPIDFSYTYNTDNASINYGSITGIDVNEYVVQPQSIVHSVYDLLEVVSRRINTFYEQNLGFDSIALDTTFDATDTANITYSGNSRDIKFTGEDLVIGTSAMTTLSINDNEYGARSSAPLSLRELEAAVLGNKYNIENNFMFISKTYAVTGYFGKQERDSDNNIISGGSLYQMHRDYNGKVDDPNTYFKMGGKGTAANPGYDIGFGDLGGEKEYIGEAPNQINVYLLDKHNRRTTVMKESLTPLLVEHYGNSPLLASEQGEYTGADVYMAADGTWRYKAEHMRLPILRSRY